MSGWIQDWTLTRARVLLQPSTHGHSALYHTHTHITHAHNTCTQHMHTTHAHNTCTHHMHTPHAHNTCTQHMHTTHAHNTCTHHTHNTHNNINYYCCVGKLESHRHHPVYTHTHTLSLSLSPSLSLSLTILVLVENCMMGRVNRWSSEEQLPSPIVTLVSADTMTERSMVAFSFPDSAHSPGRAWMRSPTCGRMPSPILCINRDKTFSTATLLSISCESCSSWNMLFMQAETNCRGIEGV